jgi:predicted phage tail protein
MQRNIYLEGELGDKFGHKMSYHAETITDALKLIEVNNSDFRYYLIDAAEKGIGFHIDIVGSDLEYDEELLLPLHEGDITITPIAAGAKGAGKVFAAILLVALIVVSAGTASGPLAGLLGSFTGTGTGLLGTGLSLTWQGSIVMGLAASLAMMGVAEMMAPDPATDSDQEQSYLFNGSEQNVIEGDPLPLLYGRLRIPGQPVNFEIQNIEMGSPTEDSAISFMGFTMPVKEE